MFVKLITSLFDSPRVFIPMSGRKKIRPKSSRLDIDSMLGPLLISAERESETEGKGGKVCGSNLMYYTKYVVRW